MLLSGFVAFSQAQRDTAFFAVAKEHPLAAYDKALGIQKRLYNGSRYLPPEHELEEHPYFISPDWLNGSVHYDGEYFSNVPDMSKVAYAEILDKANFPVLQAKIKLIHGRGDGSFFLPASLSSGQYRLRLYTSWMKNFSSEFYFDEVFSVVNPFVVPDVVKKSAGTFTVDFFPEGGHLVSGIKSKIAFRIRDEKGKGANVRGWVINDENDTIASFAAQRFGIGHLYMTPFADQRYKVVLANTGTRSYLFPGVQPEGYVMHLEDSAEFIRVAIHGSAVRSERILLFAHARQQIVSAQAKLLQGHALFEIPKASLVEGITHLTVFNSTLQPLCERLYFTYPKRALSIEITTNQKVFSSRRKVSVTLTAQASGSPASSHLSMSVFKVDSLSNANATHIYPYLWLTSDLTGRIESPEYYFTNPSQHEVAAAMDDLMLTHGWRRFEWDDVLSKGYGTSYLPEVNEHIVTASVTKDGQPLRGVFAYLASPGKIIRAYGSWTNDQGLARFDVKDFYGTRRLILQVPERPVPEFTEGEAGSGGTDEYTIDIKNPFSASIDSEKMTGLELDEALRKDLVARSIAMQVQDIFYYEQSASQVEKPEVDSSAFYGPADATYYLDDYTRFPVMEEVMREYVPGVFVRKRKDGFHFIVINSLGGGVLYGDPMVMVDGVPVLDVDDIMRMDPLRVKKLDVVTRTYYLGHATFPGIVSYPRTTVTLTDWNSIHARYPSTMRDCNSNVNSLRRSISAKIPATGRPISAIFCIGNRILRFRKTGPQRWSFTRRMCQDNIESWLKALAETDTPEVVPKSLA